MEEEKHTQAPTIKKTVTYIVDENGVEHELNESGPSDQSSVTSDQ